MGTDELILLYGATWKLTNHDKISLGFDLGVTMNQVRAQTVATAEFTPVQSTKRRGRPRNTEKSKRTKRKSRAKSLNYGVGEAQITEETL